MNTSYAGPTMELLLSKINKNFQDVKMSVLFHVAILGNEVKQIK